MLAILIQLDVFSPLHRWSEVDSSSHVAEGVREETKGGGGALEVKGETVVDTEGESSSERDRSSGQPMQGAKGSQSQHRRESGSSKKKACEREGNSNIGIMYN